MNRVRFLSGRVNLNALDPANLTAVSKALAVLDAAGHAGVIEWFNTPRRPPLRPYDGRKPGERSLHPQERAILEVLAVQQEEWMSAEVLATRLHQHLPSTKVRLKELHDAGFLERRPLPRQIGARGRYQHEYHFLRTKELTG